MNPMPILVFVFVSGCLAAAAMGQCVRQWAPGEGFRGTNDDVLTVAAWDPDGAGPASEVVVAAGTFTKAGTETIANLATFDPATDRWSAMMPSPAGGIVRLHVLNGALIAATGSGVVRWTGSTWQPLGGSIQGISCLVSMPNGDLVVGGSFTQVGGISMPFLARWNGATWQPVGGGFPNNSIRCAAVRATGELVVGGSFSSIGAAAVGSCAQWNGSSWTQVGSSTFMDLRAIVELPNGSIAVATYNGVALANGTTWTMLGLGGANLSSLMLGPNQQLLAAGNLGLFPPGQLSQLVAAWNGSQWQALGSGVTDTGYPAFANAMTLLANGDLVVGGSFENGPSGSTAPNGRLQNIARWDGASWSSLGRSLNRPVRAMAQMPNGDLMLGGEFVTDGRTRLQGIARRNGNTLSPVGGGVDGTVTALAVAPNSRLLVGGGFTQAGGVAAANVALWDGTAWSPIGGGVNQVVLAVLVMPNGDFVVAGDFTTAGGSPATSIARWNGSTWSPLGGGLSGRVNALALAANGDVIAGGSFLTAGGVTVNRVARWNGSSWSAFGSGLPFEVRCLATLPSGSVVAGTEWVWPSPLGSILQWDGSSWQSMQASFGAPAYALLVQSNGDLLACGNFYYQGAGHVLRWRGTWWEPLIPGADFDFAAYCMANAPNGDVWVGGEFTTVGGAASRQVARIVPTCPATSTPAGAGCVGAAGPLTLETVVLPWIGATSRCESRGFAANELGLGVIGFSPMSLPLSLLHPSGVPGCDLAVTPDVVVGAVPVAGSVSLQVQIPQDPALVGISLREQVLAIELDLVGNIVRLAATNAVNMVVGAF